MTYVKPITRELLAIRAADAAAAWLREKDAKKSLPLWSKMMSAVKAYNETNKPSCAQPEMQPRHKKSGRRPRSKSVRIVVL